MRNEPYLKPLATGVFAVPPKIVRLPDGTLMATVWPFQTAPQSMRVAYSKDSGTTWSDPVSLFDFTDLTPGQVLGAEAVVDAEGEVHFFVTQQWTPDFRGEGERGGPGTYAGQRIDIWHARSSQQRTQWSHPKRIWAGYTGSLNSCLILKSGRIVLPFSYYVNRTWGNRGTGLEAYTFFGMFICVTLCSDDGGTTWTQSHDLKVSTPDISGAYGACEPVALELTDGRVWMLIRTQLGRFYESFSLDGLRWSKPTPSSILSSDSPAGLARLSDGRMVLLWNNCLRFPYAYGGRQVIHAAISADQGRTWRGFREVGRDPHRDQPPPPSGDFGSAYPYPVVTADDKILISTGQGQGRALLMRLDPEYLYATRQKSDFSAGLDDWSTFGTRGVTCPLHPSGEDGARVLSLQRTDSEFPAAAVWNFPMGRKGVVRLRVWVQAGSRGLGIGLTDHFSTPYDPEEALCNSFNLRLAPPPGSPDSVEAGPGAWRLLELRWDCDRRQCAVYLDGNKKSVLPLQHSTAGVSYLRLRALAEEPEIGGVLVDSAEADVSRSW